MPEVDSAPGCPSTATEVPRCWQGPHRSTVSSRRSYRVGVHDHFLFSPPYKMCTGRGWSKHRPITEIETTILLNWYNIEGNSARFYFFRFPWRTNRDPCSMPITRELLVVKWNGPTHISIQVHTWSVWLFIFCETYGTMGNKGIHIFSVSGTQRRGLKAGRYGYFASRQSSVLWIFVKWNESLDDSHPRPAGPHL